MGLPGVTRIVQGKPGAGKSSILAELKKRQNVGVPKEGDPRVLVLPFSLLSDFKERVRRLVEMVDSQQSDKLFATHDRKFAVSEPLGYEYSGVSGQYESGSSPDRPTASLAFFYCWVRTATGGKGLSRPIIIAVDEAQNLPSG